MSTNLTASGKSNTLQREVIALWKISAWMKQTKPIK